jgi:membrane-associated phospholipid phosphatase
MGKGFMGKKAELEISKPANAGLLLFEMLAVTAVSFIATWGFARISSKLQQNNLQPFKTDIRILNFLSSIESPKLTKVMEAITSLGNVKGISMIAGALTLGFLRSVKHKVYSFEIPVISIGCGILNLLFKAKYKRLRPEGHALRVTGWSYPSGHAMASISLYGFLAYLLIFKSKFSSRSVSAASTILLLLILMIGLSRSYLKAHFPSDVIAGYAVGFLWLSGSIFIVHQLEEFTKKKESEQATSV